MGTCPPAIRAAERLAQLEPDDKAGHRLVMRLHAKNGDRVAALQHHQRLVATLHAEVGADVEPAEETTGLYRRIAAREARRAQAAETVPEDVGD